MRLAKAATGARRYNMGTSNAPTRGKVNPSGYIQREVRNRNQQRSGMGRDGQSDRRSGLAKTALTNASKYVGWRGPTAGKSQNPSIRQKPNRGSIPKPSGMKIGIPGFKDDRVTAPGFIDGPQIPNLKIGENGQLDLPFDEGFGLGLLDQQQAMNSELLDLQQEQQMQAMQHANTKRDLGLQFEDVKRGTLNNNAAGGTAFSSQYAVGASNNARNFNNASNDLDMANTLANSGFANQRMGIQNAFNDYVRQAVLRRSMDLAPEAGDLGYGIDAPNADWMDPSRNQKYPGKAQHNKSTLKKSTKEKSKLPTKPAKSKTTNKSSPIRKLKKR